MAISDCVKVAIHDRPGSFSDRWIEYCKESNINYRIVDCYNNKIVEELKLNNVLLWNYIHSNYVDTKIARYVINAAEKMGLVVFPSSDTCRTFDNKIGQKYQLESIQAPIVPTYIFYNKNNAMEWIEKASFPKVFKLSKGAGALNVLLVNNIKEGQKLIQLAFSRGFKVSSGHIIENIQKFSISKTNIILYWYNKFKRLPNSIKNIYSINKMMGREIGYVYFQDYIPNLLYDTRVVIIGKRAFAFRRYVRKNDFRASGSGIVSTDPKEISIEIIQIGFQISNTLKLQSAAYDFIIDNNGKPYLVEVSYTFPSNKQVKDCPGHWDNNLNWIEGEMWPQDAIIQDLIVQFKTCG